jgi:2-hydroxy-6-oxonona-2,4-dienedioate hydrolase
MIPSAPNHSAAQEPVAQVAALDACCSRRLTRCGEGHVVWRTWGRGRPLVLLHGGGGSWNHWVRNIGPLSRLREVWCPDQPAFGESADPPPPGGFEQIARTVGDGLDLLLPGEHAFDLVGFSFGAAVSLRLARDRPGRIGTLVLVGATGMGLPRPPLLLKSWRGATDPAERLAIHRHNLLTLMTVSDPGPEAAALHALNVERARFDGREVAGSTLVRDLIGSIDVAGVAAIYGARDAAIGGDAGAAEAVLRARRPDLRFTSIPDAGHWVQFEAPDAFDAALQRALGPKWS